MKTGKDKISARQLFFIFTIIVSSPATRFLPKYVAAQATQAGWVAPALSTVPLIVLILIIDFLMNRYEDKGMYDIVNILMGKYIGKLVLVSYLLWTLWLLAVFTRYYVERLTSSVYPHLNNNVLIILTLIPIAYMLRSGFTVIARMGEVLLPFIGTVLILLTIFLLGRVRSDNVLPVYFNDIIPIAKASLGSTGATAYLILLFFLGDKVVNKKSFRVFGYIATYINISSMVLVCYITIGVLSGPVAQRAPMPVLAAVK